MAGVGDCGVNPGCPSLLGSQTAAQVFMTSSTSQNPASRNPSDGKSEPSVQISVYQFEQLAAGAQEVLIEHRGQQYRLRVTRNGGLILNK